MKKLLLTLAVLLGTVAGPLSAPALACPNCKAGNEQDANLPKAYMYSILFMLAVPATVATGFGIGFYRLSRQTPGVVERNGEVDGRDDVV